LNKYSPWAYVELEFDVLGVARKLVKYKVHPFKKNKNNKHFSSYNEPNQQITNFWSQGILGINWKIYNLLKSMLTPKGPRLLLRSPV
jgi:hypothetical protein